MKKLTRRDFLKLSALSAAAAFLASCGSLPESGKTPPAAVPVIKATAKPTGSGNPSATPRKTEAEVLVIGAGMAGLAAASELVKKGYEVILLEARDRIGGRIWTDRSLGLPLDLGASWIHGVKGNPISQLADQLNAKRIKTDYEKIVIYNPDGVELSDSESAAVEALFEDLQTKIENWQDEFEQDLSLQEAVNRYLARKSLSIDQKRKLLYAINTTIEHEYAADIKDLSLFEFDQAGEFSGGDVILAEGYDQVTRLLAEGLDYRLEHLVRAVKYGPSGVTVETDPGTFTAAKAVITVPLGILKSGLIQFTPGLPAAKLAAINALGFGVLNKLYLKFPSAFWEQGADLLGYISQKKGEWCEWLNLFALTGEPVLLGFNAGAYGLEIESLSDTEIISSALRTLKTIYGERIPDPEGWLITRWGRDPFTLGSYSSIKVNSSGKTLETLAAPVAGRLFFAGEATHREHHATVHGAYLSGLRAAKEVG